MIRFWISATAGNGFSLLKWPIHHHQIRDSKTAVPKNKEPWLELAFGAKAQTSIKKIA